jgi:TrmH family RNA methyltransferase
MEALETGAAEAILDRVHVVLDEPQDLVNIAAVIRLMKNMGLSRLRVVNPAEWDAWRITGIAHRTDDLVEATEHFESLDDALADCVLVVGTSARARTAHRNYGYAREWAGRLASAARNGKVALVFGREDRGLSNEALDRCDGVAVIPTFGDYSSLNMAQAAMILAYEISLSARGDLPPLPRGKRMMGPATRDRLETMFHALEGGLDRVEFFRARKAESVMRTFRTLFARAELDQHEAGLVQAFGFEVQKYFGKRGDCATNRDEDESDGNASDHATGDPASD